MKDERPPRILRGMLKLGLRGPAVRAMNDDAIVEILDVSELVAEQREHVRARAWDRLVTPAERVYLTTSAAC
jgi:hypothetical protein